MIGVCTATLTSASSVEKRGKTSRAVALTALLWSGVFHAGESSKSRNANTSKLMTTVRADTYVRNAQ